MKKIFIALLLTGVIIALGTAGTSDLEQETHQQLMTNKQFYTQIAISLGLLSIGGIGMLLTVNKQNEKRENPHGTLYLQKMSNNAAARNTYHTRTKATHGKSQKRSAS